MAPILSLLRSMAERGITRKATFYYGARRSRDLCFEAELRELEKTLENFRYVPALSEPDDSEDWNGEVGLITDVVKRHETNLKEVHAYICGPPPMVEAAVPLLTQLGVPTRNACISTSSPPLATPTKGEETRLTSQGKERTS